MPCITVQVSDEVWAWLTSGAMPPEACASIALEKMFVLVSKLGFQLPMK